MRSKIMKFFFGTYVRGFVVSYLLFLFFGAFMLMLPVSIQDGQSLSLVDAVFVSVSGMSTTGLTTIVVKDTFTAFGQTVLAFILQFGGIGLIMFVAIFWLLIGKKINFRERTMIMQDQNQLGRNGIVRFIKNVLLMIITIELIGFLTMGTYLFLSGYFDFKQAYFQAFFLTISMFTNAGFDISPTSSLFMYKNDYFMQTLAMVLMFLGAVGFWPLVELKEKIKAKRNKQEYEFSLFAKILVFAHLGLWLVSALMVFLIEYNDFLVDKSFFEGLYYCLFMSLTTRNAGFATMDMNNFTNTTQVFFGILMFIGSSPNSAGGGIRTTTLLMTILGIRAFAKGKEQVVIKNKAIKPDAIYKSLIVFIGAITLIITALFVMTISEPFTIQQLFFEIASAFGTTGLSLGITPDLSLIGKIVLIVVMFIGRIGILALLLMFRGKGTSNNIKYPEIEMIVG